MIPRNYRPTLSDDDNSTAVLFSILNFTYVIYRLVLQDADNFVHRACLAVDVVCLLQ